MPLRDVYFAQGSFKSPDLDLATGQVADPWVAICVICSADIYDPKNRWGDMICSRNCLPTLLYFSRLLDSKWIFPLALHSIRNGISGANETPDKLAKTIAGITTMVEHQRAIKAWWLEDFRAQAAELVQPRDAVIPFGAWRDLIEPSRPRSYAAMLRMASAVYPQTHAALIERIPAEMLTWVAEINSWPPATQIDHTSGQWAAWP